MPLCTVSSQYRTCVIHSIRKCATSMGLLNYIVLQSKLKKVRGQQPADHHAEIIPAELLPGYISSE